MAISEGAKLKESNMQFVVTKQNHQKELSFVQGVVEKKNTIPVLSNILIESVGENTIRITGTDLDVTIRCDMDAEEVSTPGSICVQARKLFEIARLRWLESLKMRFPKSPLLSRLLRKFQPVS